MADHGGTTVGNRLLAALQPDDYNLLANALECIECPLRLQLAKPGIPFEDVVFLDEGVASVVARSADVAGEAGLIGREGFVIPSAALGVNITPHLCQMQLPGRGRRIGLAALAEAAEASATLRALLLRFVQAQLVQSAYTTLSNAVHSVDVRLARWLLMCHDRWDSDDIPLTHDFIATMLAVRRPSVTTALHILEGQRLINSERGYVHIRNRAALETYAADAYGQPEAEYRRVFGEAV